MVFAQASWWPAGGNGVVKADSRFCSAFLFPRNAF